MTTRLRVWFCRWFRGHRIKATRCSIGWHYHCEKCGADLGGDTVEAQ